MGHGDLLRRLPVLHHRCVPHLPGSRRRRAAQGQPVTTTCARLPTPPHRLVGECRATRTLLNLLGSIAFGVAAVASYVIPATGELRDAERANLGTLVGAICFLIGALLLLPERTEEIDPDAASGGERTARP